MTAELLLGSLFPWITALFLGVFILIHLLLLPKLVFRLLKAHKLFLIVVLLSLVGGAYLRFTVVPNQHRIFYDEDRYLGYSVSFARLNKAVSVELATPQESIIGKPDQAVRITVPVLHGLVLKLFGFSEEHLFNTSRVLSLLLAVYVAALSIQLFRSYLGAIIALLGMLYLPIQVYWSASMALDPYFVFFAVASVVAMLTYLSRSSKLNTIYFASTVFLLLCVRIEAFILLPLFAYIWVRYRQKQGLSLFQKDDIFLFSLLLPLILARGFASISVLGQKWCCADSLPLEAFSMKYITRNTLPNLLYLISGYEFPSVLSIPALWLALHSKNYTHRFLLLWIIAFFALYTFYYAGLFVTAEFSGSYARYFLILIPPLFVLFGDFIASYLYPWMKRARKNIFIGLIFILINLGQLTYNFWNYKDLLIFMPAMFNAVDQGPVYVHAYLEHIFLKKIPKNSVVIHPITSVPYLKGHTSVYYQYFLENDTTVDFVRRALQRKQRVFIMNALECGAIPYKCEKIQKIFSARRSSLNEKSSNTTFEIYELYLNK